MDDLLKVFDNFNVDLGKLGKASGDNSILGLLAAGAAAIGIGSFFIGKSMKKKPEEKKADAAKEEAEDQAEEQEEDQAEETADTKAESEASETAA